MAEWDPAPTTSNWQGSASWWSQWWSQQSAKQKWRPEDYLYKQWGEPTASSRDTSIESSKSTGQSKAADKRARRAANASKHELDTIQRFGRRYSKHLRTAAATMFRTQIPYHDSFLGMCKVPQRGEHNPTDDAHFQLDPEEPPTVGHRSPAVFSRLPAQVADQALSGSPLRQ